MNFNSAFASGVILFTRGSISLLLIIAVVTWGAFLWVLGIQLTWEHAKPYSLTLAVLTGGWSLFNKYLWRMWPCKLFVRRPNLNGTWKAELRSTYKDPATGEPRGLIDAYVAIRQTFTSLSVRLLTAGDHESFLVVRIPGINRTGFRSISGQRSDLKPDSIPINYRTVFPS